MAEYIVVTALAIGFVVTWFAGFVDGSSRERRRMLEWADTQDDATASVVVAYCRKKEAPRG